MPTNHHRIARGILVLATVVLVVGPGRATAAPSQVAEPEVRVTATSGSAFHALVGVSFFREYFCESDGWCPYRADIKVTVVPAGEAPTDPEGTTPAAAAAAPVSAAPELTG